MKNFKQIDKKTGILAIVVIGCFILCVTCSAGGSIVLVSVDPGFTRSIESFMASVVVDEPEEMVLPHKVVGSDGSLRELWSRSNVFASPDHPSISAAGKVVFVLGNTVHGEPDEIIAIDATDGKQILWRGRKPNDLIISARLHATPSALYVGSGGIAYLVAYDLRTGDELRSKYLGIEHGVVIGLNI
ncbi:MAG: hypothetical protein GY938_29545 [Ketobacter sp.]|nr:hypothetical protein [Ketobacter sp.]